MKYEIWNNHNDVDATDDDNDGENDDDCDDIHRIVKREGSDQT